MQITFIATNLSVQKGMFSTKIRIKKEPASKKPHRYVK